MYIGVQGTVESLLGAIFETYLRHVTEKWFLKCSNFVTYRNGFVNGSEKKTNIRNIFSEDVITIILEYYKEVILRRNTRHFLPFSWNNFKSTQK